MRQVKVLNCDIDLSASPIELITGQGTATGTLNTGDLGITINGNGWNAIELPQNITVNTVLELEFSSSPQGEEHAIGFTNSLAVDGVNGSRFKLYGTQNVPAATANQDFTYNGSCDFQSFSIPIGESFTEDFEYIVFVNDNNVAPSCRNSSEAISFPTFLNR